MRTAERARHAGASPENLSRCSATRSIHRRDEPAHDDQLPDSVAGCGTARRAELLHDQRRSRALARRRDRRAGGRSVPGVRNGTSDEQGRQGGAAGAGLPVSPHPAALQGSADLARAGRSLDHARTPGVQGQDSGMAQGAAQGQRRGGVRHAIADRSDQIGHCRCDLRVLPD